MTERMNLKQKLNRTKQRPIRVLMRSRGLTIPVVAKRMGISEPTVRKYIKDPRKMNDYQTELLAHAIGVDKSVILQLRQHNPKEINLTIKF